MRQKFITGADFQLQPSTGRLTESSRNQYLAEDASESAPTRYLARDAPEVSLSKYLAEEAMPQEYSVVMTANAIFLADPAAAAAAKNYLVDAPFQCEMLRIANVSLESASELMSVVI